MSVEFYKFSVFDEVGENIVKIGERWALFRQVVLLPLDGVEDRKILFFLLYELGRFFLAISFVAD